MSIFLGNRSRIGFFNQPASSGGGSSSGGNITIGPLFGNGTTTVTPSVGTVSVSGTTTDTLAEKDVYYFNTVGCAVDDANHDGEDLIFDGLIAARKDVLIGWDLSSYLSGASVSSASFTVKFQNIGLAIDSADLQHISNANETWNEGTISCSTAPAGTGVVQTMVFPVAAADETTTLNSTARSRIASRMGAGYYSLQITPPVTNVISRTMEAADEGTNDASSPRLTFSWSKNL